MTDSFPTGRASTFDLFRPVETPEQALTAEQARILQQRLADGDRTICRWCLQLYDPQMAKPRTTWERGQLRTRLRMSDNGQELVICDACWDGTFYPQFTMGGRPQGTDPEVVPNLLLR